MCVCECRRTSRSPLSTAADPTTTSTAVMATSMSVLMRSPAHRHHHGVVVPKPKLAGSKVDHLWRDRRWCKSREQDDQEAQNGAGSHSLLKCLALQALELSAPATDVLLKSGCAPPGLHPGLTPCAPSAPSPCPPSSWFQLTGHADCFAPAGYGRIWKKVGDSTEKTAYESLQSDEQLRGLVPQYYGSLTHKDNTFIELQDLLHGFSDPHVIDVKMGTRTFLESEVNNPTARADLYQKMVEQDATAPTAEEHAAKAVTKVRYMQLREQQSSTHFLGFRIDAMKEPGQPPRASHLKRVANRQEVVDRMAAFLDGRVDVQQRLLQRLCDMRTRIEGSTFFRTHEVIGCSIFMLYDNKEVGAWLIDFAKTVPVPDHMTLDHRQKWIPGNHEEGFLLGLDNLITVVKDALS